MTISTTITIIKNKERSKSNRLKLFFVAVRDCYLVPMKSQTSPSGEYLPAGRQGITTEHEN